MAIVMTIYLLVKFTYLYILPVDKLIDVYKSQNGIAAIAVVNHFASGMGVSILTFLILFLFNNISIF